MKKYTDKKDKKEQKEKTLKKGTNFQKSLGNDLNNCNNIVSNKEERSNFTSDIDVFDYIVEKLDGQINGMCGRYVRYDNYFEDIKNVAYTVVWDKLATKTRDSEGYLLDSVNKRVENILGYASTVIRYGLIDNNRKNSADLHLSDKEKKLKGNVRKLKGSSEKFSNQEIADILDVEIKDVEKSLINLKGYVNLDEKAYDEGNSATIGDNVGEMDENIDNLVKEDYLRYCVNFVEETLIHLYKSGEIDDIHVDIYNSTKEDIYENVEVSNKELAKKHNMSSSAITQRRNSVLAKIKEGLVQGGVSLES